MRAAIGLGAAVAFGSLAHADPEATPAPGLPWLSVLVSAGVVSPYTQLGAEDLGPGVMVDLGVRVANDVPTELGVHVGAAWLSGAGDDGFGDTFTYRLVPVSIAGFARATAYDRLWGEVYLGLHFDYVGGAGEPGWLASFAIGLASGVDLVKVGYHRLGVCGWLDVGKGDVSYAGAIAGLCYRE